MRSFAVVPAAGRSRRMGADKLLLPLSDGRVLLDAALELWKAAEPTAVVVVVPAATDNEALSVEIRRRVEAVGAEAVVPAKSPEEMKDSVALALAHIAQKYTPCERDAWLLAPADMPFWPSQLVRQLLERLQERSEPIAVPVFQGRRGHPVAFRWHLAARVARLGPDQGINVLLRDEPVVEVPCDDPGVLRDIDTWEEYRRAIPHK